MPARGLQAKSALEANDIILLHRASDRHRRSRRLLHRYGLAETGKRAMYVDDQPYELVGFDRVTPHIAADDLRDLAEIEPRRPVCLCQRALPDDRSTLAVI
jgi:hypothetical protein